MLRSSGGVSVVLTLLAFASAELMGFEPSSDQRSKDMSFGRADLNGVIPEAREANAGEKKYYFASIHTTLGFGDKMRWYYDQMFIAKLLGRVLILPEMYWGRTTFFELADMNSSDMQEVSCY
jgi:hypothetical protein